MARGSRQTCESQVTQGSSPQPASLNTQPVKRGCSQDALPAQDPTRDFKTSPQNTELHLPQRFEVLVATRSNNVSYSTELNSLSKLTSLVSLYLFDAFSRKFKIRWELTSCSR